MSTNIIKIYKSIKEAPENFKSQKYFTDNNLKHNGVVVGRVSRGYLKYDLYDVNTAVKIEENNTSKENNTVDNANNIVDNNVVLKEVKKDEVLPIFFSEEEVPQGLVTIMALKEKGLRHNNAVKAILKIDNSFHYLFSDKDVIAIDEAPKGANIYKSVHQASKENKYLKGISYFHQRGIMHNGIVKGIYKLGTKYNELYDCRDTFVVDKEKHNLFAKEEKATLKSLKKSADLPTYTSENVPCYLKTRSDIESEGYTPRGSAIAKLLTGKGKEFVSLYDSQNVEIKPNVYWGLQEKKIKNNPNNYVVLSVEATGLKDNDEIIQLSIVNLNGDLLFNSYFKPTRNVSLEATNRTRLTDSDLEDAPTWVEKWNEIYKIIENKTIIAYNAKVAIKLIHQTCKRYKTYLKKELKSLCAMKYANHICSYLESCSSLIKVVDYLGLKIDEKEVENRNHNTMFDTYNCLYVINKNAEVFTARKRAEECFIALCKKDPKGVGKKQRYIEGSTWLYKQYGIYFKDIKFTNLEIANSMINKLEKFV